MRSIKVVIGANFGDEGKGLVTNYFCKQLESNNKVINVRYNGSCQAGHTVYNNGESHVFQHFGAGTFNKNVITYLSSYFYINPIYFNLEYDQLVQKFGVEPQVIVSRRALVVLYYDMIFNRAIEEYRGNKRHGSCGYGMFEALLRDRACETIRVNELNVGYNRLYNRIKWIRDNYFKNKLRNANINNYNEKIADSDWHDDELIAKYVENCKLMLSRVTLSDDFEIFNEYSDASVVFEGAQGLQLDWMNREYMPYLTASRTGLHNVVELIRFIDSTDIEVCYVTRSYFTRHGAGPLNFEVTDKNVLGNLSIDETNLSNRWQGNFRYGYFDLERFKKAIKQDSYELYSYGYKRSICVTHLNETDNKIICPDNSLSLDQFRKEVEFAHAENDGGSEWNIYGSWDREEAKEIEG